MCPSCMHTCTQKRVRAKSICVYTLTLHYNIRPKWATTKLSTLLPNEQSTLLFTAHRHTIRFASSFIYLFFASSCSSLSMLFPLHLRFALSHSLRCLYMCVYVCMRERGCTLPKFTKFWIRLQSHCEKDRK